MVRAQNARLDEETSTLLTQFRSAGPVALDNVTIESTRAAVEAMFVGLAPPSPPIAGVTTGALPGEAGPLRYRLYRAASTASLRPALLFLHGGGWWLCSTSTHDSIARWLCHHGALDVLSLGYRLAPEHRFPAALNDVRAATQWLVRHAQELDVDPDRIAIGGDSAGGALAAATASMTRGQQNVQFAAQILLYPTLTLADAADLSSRKALGGGDYFLTEEAIEIAARHYLEDASLRADPRVSPLLDPDLRGMPPTLVVTAGFDPLRDEGDLYAQRLRHHGVQADYRCFESTIHGFMSFAGALTAGREGLEFVGRWLRERLGVENPPGKEIRR